MDTEVSLMIGGVVGGVLKALNSMGALRGVPATWWAFGLSSFFVLIWGVSHEATFARMMLWTYLVAIVSVLSSVAATWHTIEEAAKTRTWDNVKTTMGTGGQQ